MGNTIETKKKYDLAIAYRIYPQISKIPPVFSDSKFKLSKLCLTSFLNSLSGINYKVYAILDTCPSEYETLFKETFSKEKLTIISLNMAGNKKTFEKQIEILLSQNDSDIIYFAEDDYYYISKLQNMLNLLREKKADFVTPYEHPSCYDGSHKLNNHILLFDNQRYTSVQHACLTFMTTKANLIKNRRFLLIFSRWFASDFVVWGCITLGLNYFKYIKLLFNFNNYTLENAKVFGSMFFFAIYRFLINKKFKLYMPINTIATHMEKNFLSPCINWDTYFKTNENRK